MLSKGVLKKKHTYVLANVWKKETEKKKKGTLWLRPQEADRHH